MSSWVLGMIVVGLLAIAGCAMWISAMGENATEFLNFAERAYCYDSGFNDARIGLSQRPPGDAGDECDRLYADAYHDGLSGSYDPPKNQ